MNGVKLGRYKHYKGGEYEVIAVAIHSETLDEMVVYKELYNSEEFGENALWVRPKDMFCEKVFINGKELDRFQYIG